MKKLLGMILILSAMILSACGGKSDANTIKVGLIVPKSGPLATYGLENMGGVETAVAKINATGGINGMKVELIIVDNQGNTTESTNAYKKLISDVVAVIGPVTSGNGLAVKPLVDRYKTPLISPTGTAVNLTTGNEYLSRTCFIDPYQGKAAAAFAYTTLAKKSAVIMFDASNDYSTGLSAAFEAEYTKLGGKILKKVGFKGEDRDFNAQLTEIKKLNPEFVYVPSYHPTAGPILNQAKKLGITAAFMGGDGWDSGKLKALAGKGYAGHYFTTHFSAEDTDAMVQDFVKSFKARSKENPGAMAGLGYDAALILADALKRTVAKAGKKDMYGKAFKEELKNQINSTKNFKGVTGLISLDENRNAVKSVVVIKTTPEGPKFNSKVNP